MNSAGKINKFLVSWIAIVTFFSYSAYFFPKALKAFIIAPLGLFLISIFFYVSFVFLRRPRIEAIPEIRYLIMLLVVLFAGLLYTNAPNYGFDKIIILYTWIVLFFLYSPIIVNNFELFVKVSAFCGIVYVFFLFAKYGDPISFFQSMQGETVRLGVEEDTGKYGGLNPIWVARYLGFLFLLMLFILKKNPRNLLLYGYTLVLFLYMLTSGSKGPIVAAAGGCLVFFANDKVSVNVKTVFFLILVFAGLILLLNAIDFFSSAFYINRFSGKSSSAEEREGLIGIAFTFSSVISFLFGTGTGNFGYIVGHRDMRLYPHNMVAELYIENGVISLMILALIYISVIKEYALIFKSQKLQMLFALFIYYALNSMFSGDLFANEYFFIFFMLFHFEKLMIQKTEQLEIQLEQYSPGISTSLK